MKKVIQQWKCEACCIGEESPCFVIVHTTDDKLPDHLKGRERFINKQCLCGETASPDWKLEDVTKGAEATYVNWICKKSSVAMVEAKAKFPQPNYVTLKVASGAGEVVRAAVHYAEGRLSWVDLEGEAIQAIAMILRLLTEGDEINGVIPPAFRLDELKGA